jgi:hypothetical protein
VRPLYTLSEDGDAITCVRCGTLSRHPQDVEHRYCARCHIFLDPEREALTMWTIYDHPADFPGRFVARRWAVFGHKTMAFDDTMTAMRLDDLRKQFVRMGLVCLARDANDDPVIVETWI